MEMLHTVMINLNVLKIDRKYFEAMKMILI